MSKYSKIPKKLKLIGYWNDKLEDGSLLFDGRSTDEYARYPSPLDLVSPGWLGPEKTKLVSYLKSGISFRFYFGGSPCRFICEKRMVGCEECTDGLWAWPEGLAHYVEVHNVRLP